jgi:hypothetical protein
LVAKLEPDTGIPTAPVRCPAANTSVGRTSRTIASSGVGIEAIERWPRSEELAAVELHDALHVRRPGRLRTERSGDEIVEPALERRVETALEADRRRRLRAHRRAAQRSRDVAGKDLDAVAELDEPARLWNRPSLPPAPRREIRPGRVTDEQRVAGEDEPRLVAPRPVDHREAAVLGPVARRVDRPEQNLADLDLGQVLERLVRERCVGVGMDVDRDTVLERETAVAGDVVGVRVRLQHADEAHAPPLRLLQHGLDRVRGSTTTATPACSSPTR